MSYCGAGASDWNCKGSVSGHKDLWTDWVANHVVAWTWDTCQLNVLPESNCAVCFWKSIHVRLLTDRVWLQKRGKNVKINLGWGLGALVFWCVQLGCLPLGPYWMLCYCSFSICHVSHILHVCYFHTAASNPRLHFESIYQATCQHFSDSQSSESSVLKKSCLPVGKNFGS